jgi:hypothetical protein
VLVPRKPTTLPILESISSPSRENKHPSKPLPMNIPQ